MGRLRKDQTQTTGDSPETILADGTPETPETTEVKAEEPTQEVPVVGETKEEPPKNIEGTNLVDDFRTTISIPKLCRHFEAYLQGHTTALTATSRLTFIGQVFGVEPGEKLLELRKWIQDNKENG